MAGNKSDLERDFEDYSLSLYDILAKHGFTADGDYERIRKQRLAYRKSHGLPYKQGLTGRADAQAEQRPESLDKALMDLALQPSDDQVERLIQVLDRIGDVLERLNNTIANK